MQQINSARELLSKAILDSAGLDIYAATFEVEGGPCVQPRFLSSFLVPAVKPMSSSPFASSFLKTLLKSRGSRAVPAHQKSRRTYVCLRLSTSGDSTKETALCACVVDVLRDLDSECSCMSDVALRV